MNTSAHDTATKTTMPFVFFKASVAERAGLPIETVEAFSARLLSAYDMGEAVWMIADELRLRADAPRKHKTPRQLAMRVMKIHDDTVAMIRELR
jgi:hypothetical protein